MSKFMLSMGLGLASLVGLAGAVHADLPRPGELPLPGGSQPTISWDAEIGHWDTFQEADEVGQQGNSDGLFQAYQVIQESDGYYYLLVAYYHN
jgi:hypothetical protein